MASRTHHLASRVEVVTEQVEVATKEVTEEAAEGDPNLVGIRKPVPPKEVIEEEAVEEEVVKEEVVECLKRQEQTAVASKMTGAASVWGAVPRSPVTLLEEAVEGPSVD